MRKTYTSRFFSLLIGFSLLIFIASCVDLAVENIPQSINYRSMVKFVNNVPGVDAAVTMDGSSVGTVQSGAESAYMDAASGSRNIQANFSSGPNLSQRIVLDTERKIVVTMVEDTVNGQLVRSFVKTDEGYIWE